MSRSFPGTALLGRDADGRRRPRSTLDDGDRFAAAVAEPRVGSRRLPGGARGLPAAARLAAGDAVLEPIALRTGELYQTTEVTADGALARFSPDGRYVTYESGAASQRITHVVGTAAPKAAIAELRGWGAAFTPDSTKLAYVKTPDSPEVRAAQAALDEAPPADRVQRLAALTQLLTTQGRVAVRDLASGSEVLLDTGTISKASLFAGAGGAVLFAGAAAAAGPVQLYAVSEGQPAAALTSDPTDKIPTAINSTGTALLFTTRAPGGGRGGRGGGTGAAAGAAPAPGRGGGAAPPSASGAVRRRREGDDGVRRVAVVLARWPHARLRQAQRRRELDHDRADRGCRGGNGRPQGPRARRRPGGGARRQPRRVPDDAARGLGAVHARATAPARRASRATRSTTSCRSSSPPIGWSAPSAKAATVDRS